MENATKEEGERAAKSYHGQISAMGEEGEVEGEANELLHLGLELALDLQPLLLVFTKELLDHLVVPKRRKVIWDMVRAQGGKQKVTRRR